MKQNEYQILKEAKKVILAYSGGLDTSVLTTWLLEKRSRRSGLYVSRLRSGQRSR